MKFELFKMTLNVFCFFRCTTHSSIGSASLPRLERVRLLTVPSRCRAQAVADSGAGEVPGRSDRAFQEVSFHLGLAGVTMAGPRFWPSRRFYIANKMH